MVTIMEKSKKVLFVTEKWCDADPSKGITNNYHNLFKTFKSKYPTTQFSIIHMDEYYVRKKKHIDTFLPSVIDKFDPSVVVFSLLGKSPLNPTDESLSYIKSKGCKTVFMWPDLFDGWGLPQVEDLNSKELADLHVCWGSERNVEDIENLIWLWAPQDETMYHPDEEKTINTSFLGSPRYEERQRYLTSLLTGGVEIFIGGGQREEGLSASQYAENIRKSKISLNFPSGPDGYDQCKGRVWEILATKTLLLERANEATKNYLKPNVHYVEFTSEEDLKEKINYYLENDKEREQIALKGHEEYKKKYTSDIFWSKIMKRCKIEL